ncbi:MAG: hypothetical protein IT370_02790 [Deltaproteobacteria bacterium]|nr:hypothetical protein [Deltaproteobacteria bacterium]
MMTKKLLPFAFALTLGLAGCGGDESSGLAGMYMTTSQSENLAGCDGDGTPKTIDPAYFVVIDENLLNGLFVSAYPCTGPERSSCNTDSFSLFFLAERASGGEFITDQPSRDSVSGNECTIGWSGTRAKKTTGGIILRDEYRSGRVTGKVCTDQDWDWAAGRVLECKHVEIRVATKL